MPTWLIVVVVIGGITAALNLAAFALDRRDRRSEEAWKRTLPASVRRRVESGLRPGGGVDTPPWERRRRENDPAYRTRVLVDELCEIGRGRGFLSVHAGKDGRTREIGAELHEAGGKQRMLSAHAAVRAELGQAHARELEAAWDGVGDWRG
ncbi:hypothetical protein O7599_03655 [Streptomyces sp. WMMC500]|uniref:hypothetical protein n=1 Tax=Streptomyces sp. WMMC500 TaxID=3015154 RepID=UPI00248C6102|nr:hypothetical protein [Streptomyces sp. WMMC500]WBB61663.1 hypothetical protein O7599_03655 [Streptomyces sp. WMMC500]